MSAALALPAELAAIDWVTIAPGEWAYLVDLLPPVPPARPSGVAPRPTDHTEAIQRAVRIACAGRHVTPDDRRDLEQDLALKLIEQHAEPENVPAWLCTVAERLLAGSQRTATRRRALEGELYRRGYAAPPPYFGERTQDTSVERMHVKPTPRLWARKHAAEDGLIAGIDDPERGSGKRWAWDGRKWQRKTSDWDPDQQMRGWGWSRTAIGWKWRRTQSHNSTLDEQIPSPPVRVGASLSTRGKGSHS